MCVIYSFSSFFSIINNNIKIFSLTSCVVFSFGWFLNTFTERIDRWQRTDRFVSSTRQTRPPCSHSFFTRFKIYPVTPPPPDLQFQVEQHTVVVVWWGAWRFNIFALVVQPFGFVLRLQFGNFLLSLYGTLREPY